MLSEIATAHLKSNGLIIFLDADLFTLESRVHDFSTRGLAKRPDQNLVDLFIERFVLYTKYSDITIKSVGLTHEEVCTRIIEQAIDKR
jgi:shikimate kinase